MNNTEQPSCSNISTYKVNNNFNHIKVLKEKVLEEFSEDIKKYLSVSPARTQESLGRIMGYSAKHIGRLKNKKQFPTTEALENFYLEYFKKNTTDTLIKSFSKNSYVKQYLLSQNVLLSSNHQRNYSKELNSFLKEDADYSAIFMIITETPNITINNINKLYPIKGNIAINELVEKELITINENGHITPFSRNVTFTNNIIKHLSKQFVTYITKEKLANYEAFQSFSYSKLTDDELQNILKIQRKATQEIDKIISNSNGNGEHIVTTGQFTTTIEQPKHEGSLQ